MNTPAEYEAMRNFLKDFALDFYRRDFAPENTLEEVEDFVDVWLMKRFKIKITKK